MKTHVVDAGAGISLAADLLRAGDLVALPTETVYGLAADAISAEACAKIFQAKDRPLHDPLIVHLPAADWLPRMAHACPVAHALAAAFWPGPLTLVLERRSGVPDIVTSGQSTVALRVSAHSIFRAVLEEFGGPVAAPSANRFGRISPTTAAHVREELEGRIPLIVDGGPCLHGIESTIVRVVSGTLQILRPGPILREELASYAPVVMEDSSVVAPGMLKSHYAPSTPLEFWDGKSRYPQGGLLAWKSPSEGFAQVEILSESGDPLEAAARLYGALRRLDEAGLERITVESIPEVGLGFAIMDRLRKAAAR